MVFYVNKEKANIEEIKNIITELKSGKLNCYKNKYVDKYNNFKQNYFKKAEERSKKRKSILFTTIFQNNQQLYKGKDDKCVEETENTFEQLRDIFNKGVRTLNEQLLNICLNSIKNKKPTEMD